MLIGLDRDYKFSPLSLPSLILNQIWVLISLKIGWAQASYKSDWDGVSPGSVVQVGLGQI